MRREDPLRRTTALLATVAFALLLGMSAVPASADSAQESDFAARVNALRTSRGLNALIVDQGISTTARNWASRIAADGALSHNPNLANELPPNWTDMGENVAFGPDTATMERELENDPPHFANLTNPRFTHLGIGIVEVNGRLWGVQDFAGFGGGSPTAPSSPYAQSPSAQSPYGQPAFGQAPYAPPPAATTPAAAPNAPAPDVGVLAVTSAAPVSAPSSAPAPSSGSAPATAATAQVGAVAFTGNPIERHLRVAAAALVIGLVLLTTRGLVDLRRLQA